MSRRYYIHCDFNDCKVECNIDESATIPKEGNGWVIVRSVAHNNKEIDLCPEHAKFLGLGNG